MTLTQTIPASALGGIELKPGDALHVLSSLGGALLVQIRRSDSQEAKAKGSASEWLRSARGSVRLASGETVEDARMAFYSEKYGLH